MYESISRVIDDRCSSRRAVSDFFLNFRLRRRSARNRLESGSHGDGVSRIPAVVARDNLSAP